MYRLNGLCYLDDDEVNVLSPHFAGIGGPGGDHMGSAERLC